MDASTRSSVKHLILLGDGMADLPVPELGGRTPLEVARKPAIDALARRSACGLVRTVPYGIPPGSDSANLSVMGYDPRQCYTGRSPIEAVSMGIDLADGDVAFRCNLVTLSEGAAYAGRTMVDYSSDEIPSEESAVLIGALNRAFADDEIRFFPGRSYRHCMVWKGGPKDCVLVPPHDILTCGIAPHLPAGPGADRLLRMMEASVKILSDHPVNRKRVAAGLRPANAAWIWGQGTRPKVEPIADLFGLRGSVISAVDLVKGLGILAGLRVVDVPGATGTLETDFAGKRDAAIAEFASGQDYVYLHVEAPDECGHRHEVDRKVESIERIDAELAAPLFAWLERNRAETGQEYRILVLPDHPTPLPLRTHTADPVPFVWHDSARPDAARGRAAERYDEASCAATGYFVEEGHTLFGRFVAGGF